MVTCTCTCEIRCEDISSIYTFVTRSPECLSETWVSVLELIIVRSGLMVRISSGIACSIRHQISVDKLSCCRKTSLGRKDGHCCRVVVDTCRVVVIYSKNELSLACLLLSKEHAVVLIRLACRIELVRTFVDDFLSCCSSLLKIEFIIIYDLDSSFFRSNGKSMILSEGTFKKTELRLESQCRPPVHTESGNTCRKIVDCEIHIIKHLLHDELS